MLVSSAKFRKSFREGYESPRVTASILLSPLMFRWLMRSWWYSSQYEKIKICGSEFKFFVSIFRKVDLNIQKQHYFLSTYKLINSRKHEWKCCWAKQKMRRNLQRKVFERIKESKWGTSCKSENQTSLKHKPYSLYSKLASRTLFAAESTNSIKTK